MGTISDNSRPIAMQTNMSLAHVLEAHLWEFVPYSCADKSVSRTCLGGASVETIPDNSFPTAVQTTMSLAHVLEAHL